MATYFNASDMAHVHDRNEAYRQTQSQIYGLQDTILNSTRAAKARSSKQDTHKAVEVSSKSVLEYMESKYGTPKKILATFQYHSFKEANAEHTILPYPFDLYKLAMPRPFLPGYSSDKVNCLVNVKITYEDLKNSFEGRDSPRSSNNEIWGCGIYTDDSDPVLVLRHCGLSTNDDNGSQRTPANLHHTDDVSGTVPPAGTPFDVETQLLLMPPLQGYTSLRQFGILSRPWEPQTGALVHDGLSYGVYKIKVTPRDTSIANVNYKDREIDTSKWQ